MGNIISFGAKPPKASQSKMETLIVTPAMVAEWKLPSCQRPLRINDKVKAAAALIRSTEAIEGVLTIGKVRGSETLWLVDGQHRVEAFKISEIDEAIADVRVMLFADMAELAHEFYWLNSRLANMRPDDNLRALESSNRALQTIRKSCEFVGYDYIRRNTTSPIISMSSLLRCWSISSGETPASSNCGRSAADIAETMDPLSVQNLIAFLSTAHSAWGRDPEYYRLWGNLNMTLCMWMWQRLVLDRDRSGSKRYVVLAIPEFRKCLMSVSAESDYLSWLPGRNLTDRDRSPCYMRLKGIFVRRLSEEMGKKPSLPSPAWASK